MVPYTKFSLSIIQWVFQQCLPFSWTTLRGKHCRQPIAVMGVVDTFRPGPTVCANLFREICLITPKYCYGPHYQNGVGTYCGPEIFGLGGIQQLDGPQFTKFLFV